jgi:hypothetical protein
MLGETLIAAGQTEQALECYREARDSYRVIGMPIWFAYSSLLVATTLLQLKRESEAVGEILAALPAIEAEGAVPEGLVAVALLRESIRRKRVEPRALQSLLEALNLPR